MIFNIWIGQIGTRVYVPFRGCELEVRHLKTAFDLGQVSESLMIMRIMMIVIINPVSHHHYFLNVNIIFHDDQNARLLWLLVMLIYYSSIFYIYIY